MTVCKIDHLEISSWEGMLDVGLQPKYSFLLHQVVSRVKMGKDSLEHRQCFPREGARMLDY